jgi:hypothetical protein
MKNLQLKIHNRRLDPTFKYYLSEIETHNQRTKGKLI